MATKRIYFWIDHTAKCSTNTGMQRVTRCLARSLMNNNEDVVFVRWNHKRKSLVLATRDEVGHLARFSGPPLDRISLAQYPVAGEVRELHKMPHFVVGEGWLVVPEVTHITYQPSPPTLDAILYARHYGLRSAFIFYDAIPLKLPDYAADAEAHALYMQQIAMADLVVPISQFAAGDYIAYLTNFVWFDNRTLPNVRPVSLPGEIPECARAQQLARDSVETIILSVGTLEPRKNQVSLIDAFDQLCAKHPEQSLSLVFVGDLHPAVEGHIEEATQRNPYISCLFYLEDSELAKLFHRSKFTVFPSLEEGFGLPILESLWHGKPCICANFGAMDEVASGGGCLQVDVRSVKQIAEAMERLVFDENQWHDLAQEALARKIKTWDEYSREISGLLDEASNPVASVTWRTYGREVVPALAERSPAVPEVALDSPPVQKLYSPLLSICVTTYNRAAWLDVSLKQLTKLIASYSDVVELVVCDNASSDNTEAIAAQYSGFPGFRYFRNPVNVGMLGNLRETVHHASGRFVWILGDDDVMRLGALESVLSVILEHPTIALIYLNYAYTRHDAPRTIEDIDGFLASAIPIAPLCKDRYARIAEIATLSENFFTAIYCLVFRRDHAIKAYSQDTVGRPFSSLLTCIPTSYYVCTSLFDEMGYWIGQPCVVVNMNVSWMKYAPLWRLERLPELYELAEMRGAVPGEVDRWRIHNLQGATQFLNDIYFDDPEGNLDYFSFEGFIRRHKHLPEFRSELTEFMRIYRQAYDQGRVRGGSSPTELLVRFGLSANRIRAVVDKLRGV